MLRHMGRGHRYLEHVPYRFAELPRHMACDVQVVHTVLKGAILLVDHGICELENVSYSQIASPFPICCDVVSYHSESFAAAMGR